MAASKPHNVLKTTFGTPLFTMSGRAPTEKSPAIQLRQEEVFLMPGVVPDYSNQSTVGWVLISQLVFMWESSLMSCFLSWVLMLILI